MRRQSWVIGSLFVIAIGSLFLHQPSRGDGRSLTLDEMRTTCGSSTGGCVLSEAKTDCKVADDPCNYCLDSMSRPTVDGVSSTKVKIYLGADRKVCTTPTTANTKVCQPATVVCWTERNCDPGAVQVDKSCNGDQTGDCKTPTIQGTWFCRKVSLGTPTGVDQSEHDDKCI